MPRPFLLAALILLVSCGITATSRGAGTPTPTQTLVPIATPTILAQLATATTLPASPPIPTSLSNNFTRPPLVSLSYGDVTRSEQPVSAAWTNAGRPMIGDGVLNPTQLQPLAAPVGSDLVLTAIGAPIPTSVTITPYAFANGQPLLGTPYLPEFPAQIIGQHALIHVALAPGDYLLLVLLHWGANSASYGFRVILSPQ